MSSWSAPVRYAEMDAQGVVFNAHYLLYCDEAMGAWCVARELTQFVEGVRLKASTQTWHSSARWGDTVDVAVTCSSVGRTSITMRFEIAVGERSCCTVETIYVHTDSDGVPQTVGDADRAALLA